MNNSAQFIVYLMFSSSLLFSQQTVDIYEGFEDGWPPANWSASSFSQNGAVNYTPGGSRSASHGFLILGTAALTSPRFQIITGEELDTVSFWLRHSALTLSGSMSIDIIGSSTNDNIGLINLSSAPLNTWVKYSYTYSVLQDDTVSVRLSVSHLLSLGTMYIDDFRILKSTALPVELISFSSDINKNNVLLKWATAWEINNSGFQLQRTSLKNNPGIWHDIAFIHGNGTTSQPQDYSYTDKWLNSDTYSYRLKQIDYNGNFEFYTLHQDIIIKPPDGFVLHQNYPNPSNPVTRISYEIPLAGNVSVKIYDMTGKEVITLITEFKEAGYYQITFNGANFASGVYFYKMTSSSFSEVRKMLLIK